MNTIDKNFMGLINMIKNQSLEDIYNHIKDCFNKVKPNIQTSLEDYFKKFDYWGKLIISENNYEELYNRAESLKNHIEDYIFLYDKLEDYRSKKLLFAILNNWYNSDFETLKTSNETNYLHYFDADIVKCSKEEVIVDLGAYIGDTVIDYLNTYGTDNYKKIYCYEITDESFEYLKHNLSYYPNIEFIKKAVGDEIGNLYINKSSVDSSANKVSDLGEDVIHITTLDDDIKEPITMIKMDIEGYEQKALKGAKNHIVNDHPKLLISVYHNHEDLWKIPKMIDEMSDTYKFYLRYYGNNIFPTEIVLIAI